MKSLTIKIETIAIICLLIWIIFAQECKRTPDIQIPTGKVLIAQSVLDSLTMISQQPPDTVYIDTTEAEVIIQWRDRPVPQPQIVDKETYFYADTVTNDSLSVWAEIWIDRMSAEVKRWNLGGKTMFRTIDRIVEVPRPYPVENRIEVPTFERGIFAGLQTGGSLTGGFEFGFELTYLNRKQNYYSIGASQFRQDILIEFAFGRRIIGW